MLQCVVMGKERAYPKGIRFGEMAEGLERELGERPLLAAYNGRIRELFKRLPGEGRVDFLTLRDDIGYKTYVRGATMLCLKALADVLGEEEAREAKVQFAIRNGLFIQPGQGEFAPEAVAGIEARMRQIASREEPFCKRTYALSEAMELFGQKGMEDKLRLFRYRRSSSLNIYQMGEYVDYYYGYMPPHAGFIDRFSLSPYQGGMMLCLPSQSDPSKLQPFQDSPKLYQVLAEADQWAKRQGISTVGELNDCICSGALEDMILIQEADQERRIGRIAEQIASRGDVRFVMIAGPSSSGKTTLSHRLSIHLRTLGLRPHPIALDDYFVDREFTPRQPNGDYDFECLEALDVEGFNRDMQKLLAGEEVELPRFNFLSGKRERSGRFLRLGEQDMLVVEGIHGLNPRMAYSLPQKSQFKVYISALTSLNIDSHNRIPTTDGRLLRRLVRDARTRGADARRTLGMWKDVRRGEEKYIFPFQEEADAVFNSALVYELAVLKPFAEPLLFSIGEGEPSYYEAKRLLKFLDYFLSMDSQKIPLHSICREFVGGSCFQV